MTNEQNYSDWREGDDVRDNETGFIGKLHNLSFDSGRVLFNDGDHYQARDIAKVRNLSAEKRAALKADNDKLLAANIDLINTRHRHEQRIAELERELAEQRRANGELQKAVAQDICTLSRVSALSIFNLGVKVGGEAQGKVQAAFNEFWDEISQQLKASK